MARKLPALHLYIGDLLKEPSFSLCDWQAQNLWLRLLLYLHEMPHRGRFVKRDGITPLSHEDIARLCQMPMADFEKLIWQLLENEVASVIDGAIANRRMVKEAQLFENKSIAGKAGADARWHRNNKADGKIQQVDMHYNSLSLSMSCKDKKENAPTPLVLTPEELAEKFNAITGVKPVSLPDGKLPDTIREQARRRIKDHNTIAFWDGFLKLIEQSAFLTGRVGGRNGEKPFRASFVWIMGPKNFDKILAGTYTEQGASAHDPVASLKLDGTGRFSIMPDGTKKRILVT